MAAGPHRPNGVDRGYTSLRSRSRPCVASSLSPLPERSSRSVVVGRPLVARWDCRPHSNNSRLKPDLASILALLPICNRVGQGGRVEQKLFRSADGCRAQSGLRKALAGRGWSRCHPRDPHQGGDADRNGAEDGEADLPGLGRH